MPATSPESGSNPGRLLAGLLALSFAAALWLGPALAGAAALLLALATLPAQRASPQRDPLTREEKLGIFALCQFVLTASLSVTFGGLLASIGPLLLLLMFLPIALAVRGGDGIENGWWLGLALTSSASGVQTLQIALRDADASTLPSLFGEIALCTAFLCLPGLRPLAAIGRVWLLLPLGAFVLGGSAALAHGGGGTPLALMALLLISPWALPSTRSNSSRLAVVPLLLVGLALSYLLLVACEGAGSDRWLLSDLLQEERVTMWQMPSAIDGIRRELASALRAPELLRLLSLILMLAIATRRFLDARRSSSPALRRIGGGGLLLATGGGALCLVEPLFSSAAGAVFVAGSLGVSYGLARSAERARLGSPIDRKQTLSVTLITKNEADRVRGCLDSVHGWADEIVVLDSGSSDGTVAIAREYTDRVFETDWPGYGPQKQRALERATCEWVLSIDADEQVTPELRRDIDEALGERPAHCGYRLPWAVTIYGRRLDFGRSARAPLRLFRRAGARFTDTQIHETIELAEDSIGRLQGRLLHFTHRDFKHALEKSTHYAWLKSKQKFEAGRRSSVFYAALRAAWDFFVIYVVRLGFLDGQHGLLMAMTYGIYAFHKYAGVWTLRRASRKR